MLFFFFIMESHYSASFELNITSSIISFYLFFAKFCFAVNQFLSKISIRTSISLVTPIIAIVSGIYAIMLVQVGNVEGSYNLHVIRNERGNQRGTYVGYYDKPIAISKANPHHATKCSPLQWFVFRKIYFYRLYYNCRLLLVCIKSSVCLHTIYINCSF